MKREMILMMWIFASFQLVFGQTEVRKPTVEIFINGKMYQNGSEITVQKGQMLEVKVLQKGGRRDFVNYPDNYLKITPDVQVLSRGTNRLLYTEKGVSSEWKLISENALFSSDNHLAVKKSASASNQAVVHVGVDDFSRTYLKVNVNTIWQLTTGEEQKLERNSSEAFIYLNVAGASNTWYVSKNIRAQGTKDEGITRRLDMIQNNFDTIEYHLTHLNYTLVQKDIRDLQISINSLNGHLQQMKTANPAFNTEIHFVGLPSDRPISDLEIFEKLQSEWTRLNTFILQQAPAITETPPNVEKMKAAVRKYLDWQYTLPDNWLIVMGIYLPQVNTDNIIVPSTLQSLVEENQNYSSSGDQMNAFLRQRMQSIESETQQISQLKNKLQAVKLFDGMLRSYISSINWAEWENNRDFGFAYVK
ncbi:MAG: hypothetical protein RBS73_14235 [Prolixibacteraceae bacterium]|jgi:hypothetical protein|nr:hypothetical protein [Prolixibacteraceae bacterium]